MEPKETHTFSQSDGVIGVSPKKKARTRGTVFLHIYDELWLKVYAFLPLESLSAIELTCKHFLGLVTGDISPSCCKFAKICKTHGYINSIKKAILHAKIPFLEWIHDQHPVYMGNWMLREAIVSRQLCVVKWLHDKFPGMFEQDQHGNIRSMDPFIKEVFFKDLVCDFEVFKWFNRERLFFPYLSTILETDFWPCPSKRHKELIQSLDWLLAKKEGSDVRLRMRKHLMGDDKDYGPAKHDYFMRGFSRFGLLPFMESLFRRYRGAIGVGDDEDFFSHILKLSALSWASSWATIPCHHDRSYEVFAWIMSICPQEGFIKDSDWELVVLYGDEEIVKKFRSRLRDVSNCIYASTKTYNFYSNHVGTMKIMKSLGARPTHSDIHLAVRQRDHIGLRWFRSRYRRLFVVSELEENDFAALSKYELMDSEESFICEHFACFGAVYETTDRRSLYRAMLKRRMFSSVKHFLRGESGALLEEVLVLPRDTNPKPVLFYVAKHGDLEMLQWAEEKYRSMLDILTPDEKHVLDIFVDTCCSRPPLQATRKLEWIMQKVESEKENSPPIKRKIDWRTTFELSYIAAQSANNARTLEWLLDHDPSWAAGLESLREIEISIPIAFSLMLEKCSVASMRWLDRRGLLTDPFLEKTFMDFLGMQELVDGTFVVRGKPEHFAASPSDIPGPVMGNMYFVTPKPKRLLEHHMEMVQFIFEKFPRLKAYTSMLRGCCKAISEHEYNDRLVLSYVFGLYLDSFKYDATTKKNELGTFSELGEELYKECGPQTRHPTKQWQVYQVNQIILETVKNDLYLTQEEKDMFLSHFEKKENEEEGDP